MPPFLAPLLTFGLALVISSGHSQILTVANVFTSISIIGLIVSPLASLLSAFPQFASSLGSFERIEKFLHEIDRQASQSSTQCGSLGSCPSKDERTLQNSHLDFTSDDAILTLTDASFGPTLDTIAPLLKNVNVTLRKSTITLLLGPVGSGKTTLLKALLGQIPVAGLFQHSFKEAAYCTQTPWLTNASIQHNIVAYNEFDEAWYNTVLNAVALDKDLDQLQSGDQTVIGSKGLSLSGGQQQRIVSNYI